MSKAAMKPAANEYAEYYDKYVSIVPEGDVVRTLSAQLDETLELVRSIPEERGGHRYGPDKWSIRELLSHVVDTERIFAYRALRIARGDETPLSGFEQDIYVPASGAEARTLASFADELEHVRRANILMFETLPAEAWERRGTASDYPVTVRALAWILAGHERHHVNILRQRYIHEDEQDRNG
jgi:uncharacterized damage-inducible protein DinB